MSDLDIVHSLLSFEHKKIASKLNFTNSYLNEIDEGILFKAIGLIDRLSRINDESSRRTIIILSAILWEYREVKWDGLREFLILILTRIGFAPSTLMIDTEYDPETMKYSELSGLINQLFITAHLLKYELNILDNKFLVTGFQKNIWEKIDDYNLLGISAPTSAGKSFIIMLKAVDLLLKRPGTIIYIVPTLSLVSQVSIDFRRLLSKFKIDNYDILNTFNREDNNPKKVYVLTQEKAIGAFSFSKEPFKDIRMIVVDEIQNVERVANEDDQRAKTLFDLLIDFRHYTNPDHIIISGPRIENIGNLGIEVFGQLADEEEAKSSPVASITYSVSKIKNRYYFKQYTDLTEKPLSLVISKPEIIAGLGGTLYRPNFHNILSNVITSLGSNSINLIFSPSASQARRTAVALAASIKYSRDPELESLISYISNTVHWKYDLCNTLENGVAYHHGKLPLHIRRVLEIAISRKLIKNVVCTTTLMQGVNLPAQNIIIRNPNLFVTSQNGEPKLTNYEIANLRGRAGRLLKDFIGRTFVLDEQSFETQDAEESELFADASKEIHPSYSDVYKSYEKDIHYGLLNNEVPDNSNKEYSFLLTYIRQTILKDNDQALKKLKSVGINISTLQMLAIKKELSDLQVPVDICQKNRYWDPIDLNRLYLKKNYVFLPTSANEYNISYHLKNIIEFLNTNFPNYYQRYFDVKLTPDSDKLLAVCINAENWIREVPLKEILDSPYHDNADNIEKTIGILQNKISFGLPMLLKPLYDIAKPDSSFLRYIEAGAYHPISRRLIEYNIPRETAIFLTKTYLKDIDTTSPNFTKYLKQRLGLIYSKLDYWIKVQLEVLFDK